MNARLGTLAVFAVAVLSAMSSFIVTTVAMDSLPDPVLVGVSAVVAFVIIAAAGGWRVAEELRRLERSTLALALAGGALAFWAAPLLALTQRATSAPSGADSLFFTTTTWAVLVVLGAYLIGSERPALTGIAGAVCSAAGAAGLLASWEYPSSFSPFAKFPAREALMLLAGVAVRCRRAGARGGRSAAGHSLRRRPSDSVRQRRSGFSAHFRASGLSSLSGPRRGGRASTSAWSRPSSP